MRVYAGFEGEAFEGRNGAHELLVLAECRVLSAAIEQRRLTLQSRNPKSEIRNPKPKVAGLARHCRRGLTGPQASPRIVPEHDVQAFVAASGRHRPRSWSVRPTAGLRAL